MATLTMALTIMGTNTLHYALNVLPLHAILNSEWGSKVEISFSLKMVMLHIKLKRMELLISCRQIFCPYTHPRPLGVV